MKKKFLCCFFICLSIFAIFSEGYKIENVEYELTGLTRENSLKSKIPVDTTTVFPSERELEEYINDLQKRIVNNRIFDSASVEITTIEPSENYTKVSILIKTDYTWNIIALPYPSFDSNSGFKLKLKIKDYNFLGSMETFDLTGNYIFDTEEKKHEFDLSFDIPFPTFNFISFNASFKMDFEIGYTYGDSSPSFDLGQSLDFTKQFNEIIGVNLSLGNTFYIDPEYEDYGDKFYLKDNISVSFPVKLAEIKNFGDVLWTPSGSFTVKWDFDAFKNIGCCGLTHKDLFGPEFSFGHSISAGRVNWEGNFRNGFNVSIAQTYDYNCYTDSLLPYFNFNSKLYKKFSDVVALASAQQFYINVNGNNSEKGGELRGVRNSYFNSSSALILNFDLPIRLFQTDWVSFFNWFGLDWKWTRYVDFEFQFSPFLDVALCKNSSTGTQFLIEDGFYSCGFEMLVYPKKMKSITGRVSLGIDAVKFLDKVGNKISIVDKVTNRVFNTDWRYGSMWELFIGIGLFY